ncbi:uncharacterized protein LOC120358855 [Solenopsis invicta]|uniref:uncharacterized protein LOC120358855 n=1 Tax=Solenopsis invicta TaxID=13686 RepID=UPI00193DAD4F|nr:uncharacterized protein LOC120358855 [Solenopsis invicta]
MEELPGKHVGTTVFVHDGYVYHKDKRCKRIYRCSSRRRLECYAILMQNEVGTYILKSPHNHPADETIQQQIEIKQEMLQMFQETWMKPKEIFDTICRRNSIAAAKISYPSVRSFLNREQKRRKPEIPQTITEFELTLINYQLVQHIFKGTVISDEGYKAFIFTSDVLLNTLVTATEIYIDGTFSVMPRVPSFAQLYTIHTRYMDTRITVLFVLCEKRTMSLFNAIWQKVKELCPNALQRVQLVMSDYERAAMTIAKQIFPESLIIGCWFHFNQAVLRHWKTLELAAAPRTILGLTMALPLAPIDAFEEGLQIIQEEADMLSAEHPAVLQFTVYLRRTWLPLKNNISVSKQTNKFVENLHFKIFRNLVKLIPIFGIFFEKKVEKLTEGRTIRKIRVQYNKNHDKRITDAQSLLTSGSDVSIYNVYFFNLTKRTYLLYVADSQSDIDEEIVNETTDSVSVTENIENTPPRRRGRPRIRGRNLSSGITATSQISVVDEGENLNAGRTVRGGRSRGRPPRRRGRPPRRRGRPPRRRGRRGRLATVLLNDIREVEETTTNIEETESGKTQQASLETITNNKNEVINEDDRIFATPEDDYGALGLYDGEQNDELPFYLASLVFTSTSNERMGCMLYMLEYNCYSYIWAMRALIYL